MSFALAPSHYLAPLLAPRSIALIGASERPNSLGRVVYENLLAGGFKGELFAVNPHHATVLGRTAHASLAAIGRSVDLGIVCSPPATIAGILAEARGRLRAVAILSRAPDESGGRQRRWARELRASARAAGVRVLGPQTFGIMRTSLGLNATYGAVTALPGRLTLISQSGAIAAALLDFARTAGIGFASIVSVGSGSDVDTSELLDFALNDAQTEGILLYLETVGDARRFMSALRAAARPKPVIVLKGGRGYAAATSRAPSADRVFDAALKRAGTVRVQSYTQLFAAARILASGRLPQGGRLAILTNGRGPGLLATDRAIEAGVALAALGPGTKAALAHLLPSGSRIENPVDLRGDAPPERFASALTAVLADDAVDAGLVLHVATPAAPPAETARAVASLAKGAEKPLLAAWLGAVAQEETERALEEGGLANFYTPENAVEAFSFLVAYRRNQQWLLEAPPPQAEAVPPDVGAAERIRARIRLGGLRTLTHRQARALLTAFGIALPPATRRATHGPREVEVCVYRDDVFGPVIALRAGSDGNAQELMLPPLNRKLAGDLVFAVWGPSQADEREGLIDLLVAVSTLVCMLAWVIELQLTAVPARASGARVEKARVTIDAGRGPGAHGYRHMAIHPYPAELETALTTHDGRKLRVRPIRPEDAAAEQAFVSGLSEETRYRRFMHHLHELTPQMLARFTQVDYDRELALVALATTPQGQSIVGVARYVTTPDAETAEFAVVVADELQGKGTGRGLMRLLISAARRRGLKRLIGYVLAANTPMLKLMAALGFETRPDPGDREQVIVTLDLDVPRASGVGEKKKAA